MKQFREDLTLPDLGYERATSSGIERGRDPEVDRLVGIYRSMLVARHIDEVEAEMTSGGEAFFHVSGWGHEGSAILNQSLIQEDWLHLHYRDKALMLARDPAGDVFSQFALQRPVALGGSPDERPLE